MSQLSRRPDKKTVTIANNGTTSTAIDVRKMAWGLIAFPASMDGANITFQGAREEYPESQQAEDVPNADFGDIHDENGVQYSLPVVASALMAIPAWVMACDFIRIVSDDTETAERTLSLKLKS